MYDARNKKGSFYNGILNYRRHYKQTADVSFAQDSMFEMSDEEKENTRLFLKTCVLPRDKNDLKEKMLESKKYRNELITENFDEYKKIWDFYFVCPDLVSN